MIEPLLKAIEPLVVEELARANKQFPQFHSPHEGWAIICEEVIEAKHEMNSVEESNNSLQREVFEDNDKYASMCIKRMRKEALHLAAEAIQVAAMCDKYAALSVQEDNSPIRRMYRVKERAKINGDK